MRTREASSNPPEVDRYGGRINVDITTEIVIARPPDTVSTYASGVVTVGAAARAMRRANRKDLTKVKAILESQRR